jgi:cell division topological specificity factor
MGLLDWWRRPAARGSGDVAKERLRLVLVHDRLSMTPEMLEGLKHDLVGVLSRYFDVDSNSLAVDVQRGEGSSQLVTTISVTRKHE